MEPLPDRGTPHNQPPGRLAQQDQEERSPSHPNIYQIIEVLQNTQAVAECTIIQYEAGGARPPQRRRYIVMDTRLQLLKDRYHQGLINVVDYADAASHLLHLDLKAVISD